MKIKKFSKRVILVLPVISFLTAYTLIPDEISVTKGQNIGIKGGFEASINTDNVGRFDCPVKFFGVPLKDVSVSVNPKRYVIPSGEPIGVRLYTDGVLVVGLGSVRDEDDRIYEPAKRAGIEIGDRLVEINGKKIVGTEEFSESINASSGQAQIKVVRGKKEFTTTVSGVYSGLDSGYKLGLWVRDSTAGIGTMTFYNPEDDIFGALGHAICDSDTGDILIPRKGSISECEILDCIEGKDGSPGELIGRFGSGSSGRIATNCSVGIFGTVNSIPKNEPVEVASKYSIKEGKAEILCDVDGLGVRSYEIEITSVMTRAQSSNKNFVIKVTDKTLLEKTGGIVQGMSGSPIIQNGKLIGAVTHVFVNDSQKGYGIFIENMLAEAEKISGTEQTVA